MIGQVSLTSRAYCSTSAGELPELTAMKTTGCPAYCLASSYMLGHFPRHLGHCSSKNQSTTPLPLRASDVRGAEFSQAAGSRGNNSTVSSALPGVCRARMKAVDKTSSKMPRQCIYNISVDNLRNRFVGRR